MGYCSFVPVVIRTLRFSFDQATYLLPNPSLCGLALESCCDDLSARMRLLSCLHPQYLLRKRKYPVSHDYLHHTWDYFSTSL